MTSHGLLEVAESLCPIGPGRPRHAALRRAVSTAYYALFTAVTEEVARLFIPAVRDTARRMVAHSAARTVFQDLRALLKVPWLEGKPACDEDLLFVARVFADLQAKRHLADYDHTYGPSKGDTGKAIEKARGGVASLRRARSRSPEQLEVACMAMIVGGRVRAQMTQSG